MQRTRRARLEERRDRLIDWENADDEPDEQMQPELPAGLLVEGPQEREPVAEEEAEQQADEYGAEGDGGGDCAAAQRRR